MTTREAQEAQDGSPRLVTRTLRDVAPSSDAELGEIEVIVIRFQLGPIAEVGINGCQIEDVLDVLIARLEGLQRGPLACAENHAALLCLWDAESYLSARTHARQAQGVKGTNQPHQAP